MGIIRLLLAAVVVIAHTVPIFGISSLGGTLAVQSFYIISGFYMALILNQKYQGVGSYKLFITNRFLKIYPIYWAMIIFIFFSTIIMYFVKKVPFVYFDYVNFLDTSSWIYLITTNIIIIGQDLTLFLEFKPNGILDPTFNFWTSKPPVYTFLLVPQAWSLSVELMFYLIAPFIVRRSAKLLTIIILISFVLRFSIYSLGYSEDPWNYRFFPNEIAFFLLGSLAYKLSKKLKESQIIRMVGLVLLYVVCLTIFFYQYIFPTAPKELKQWLFYGLLTASIPYIFNYTKNIKVDIYIGELSYPMYISHLFIFSIINWTGMLKDPQFSSILTTLCCILFSMFLNKFIMKPIDSYRQSRLKSTKANQHPGIAPSI